MGDAFGRVWWLCAGLCLGCPGTARRRGARAPVQLAPVRVVSTDPLLRQTCAEAVAGALRGRGFLLGELGPTVAVEVQFGYEPAGVAGRASAAADVTATVRSPDGREREVLASSVGDVALPEAPTDLLSASARAGRFACEGAALRLAEALEELFAR